MRKHEKLAAEFQNRVQGLVNSLVNEQTQAINSFNNQVAHSSADVQKKVQGLNESLAKRQEIFNKEIAVEQHKLLGSLTKK